MCICVLCIWERISRNSDSLAPATITQYPQCTTIRCWSLSRVLNKKGAIDSFWRESFSVSRICWCRKNWYVWVCVLLVYGCHSLCGDLRMLFFRCSTLYSHGTILTHTHTHVSQCGLGDIDCWDSSSIVEGKEEISKRRPNEWHVWSGVSIGGAFYYQIRRFE